VGGQQLGKVNHLLLQERVAQAVPPNKVVSGCKYRPAILLQVKRLEVTRQPLVHPRRQRPAPSQRQILVQPLVRNQRQRRRHPPVVRYRNSAFFVPARSDQQIRRRPRRRKLPREDLPLLPRLKQVRHGRLAQLTLRRNQLRILVPARLQKLRQPLQQRRVRARRPRPVVLRDQLLPLHPPKIPLRRLNLDWSAQIMRPLAPG